MSGFLNFLDPASSSSATAKNIFISSTLSSVTERGFRPWETWHAAMQKFSSGRGDQLRGALRDLDEAEDEAFEEGFPVPSEVAIKATRRLLLDMYSILPWRFEIYPTPDGEIAIDAPSGSGHSVLLLCDSNGGALCMVNMEGTHRRARYSDVEQLPDGFVREALNELKLRSG